LEIRFVFWRKWLSRVACRNSGREGAMPEAGFVMEAKRLQCRDLPRFGLQVQVVSVIGAGRDPSDKVTLRIRVLYGPWFCKVAY
jgi:hypothetical protein